LRELSGPLAPPPAGQDVDDSGWPIVAPNSYWGKWQTDFVLRTTFAVPADWLHAAPLALHLPLGTSGDFEHPEALAYVDGVAYATLDRHHQELLLPEHWRDGRTHQLALHGWTGIGGDLHSQPTRPLMPEGALVQIDEPTRNFIATARVALGMAQHLDERQPARAALLHALDAAFKVLETREPHGAAFYASVANAHRILSDGIARAGPPLPVNIVAVGHAHIDVAWLWTLGQTRRKAGRTFHNVIRLMEQFPDYRFTQSQPQLYDFIRQDYPELFSAIQQRVAEGRWEPIGGMWVEADCNLSGAEALARQFLLGRRFFRRQFGREAESPVLWLPDVFGYAWNLPQLIKQAGLEYFFTIKIGWSQYNRMPYDSFWWQGLDGTRVLTHYSTTPDENSSAYASTYNAEVTPRQVLGTWENFQQKEAAPAPLLMAYGFGDGGGGPTAEMLENARELAHFPASPRVQLGTARDFFRQLEAEAGADLPVWNGELYLEYHRGTYTTQSRNKRANRQCEFGLHDAEFLASLATLIADAPYPHAEFTHAWELVCLNQFHDIIPGSSIGPVYTESQQQYTEVRALTNSLREASLRAIARTLNTAALVVNPTSFVRRDPLLVPGDAAQLPPGLTTQAVAEGVLVDAGELPPYSVTPLAQVASSADDEETLSASLTHLENACLRVEFDAAGDLVRVFDKDAQREVLAPGAVGNQFQAFEDRPLDWDAWDIDIFYDDKQWLAEPATSVRVVEGGPLRATLEIRRRILNSDYTQRISLTRHSPRLDFATTLAWREKHILLKVAFPVEVLSSVATYEIQWGNVQRPTHRNTSWDWARFETCAHKWVDLSEGGYGVSLLNDCKYGHDLRDNVLRLSLLRSPTLPDPHADEGEHTFTYSLLPHHGPWSHETVREAYALNDPLIPWVVEGGPEPRNTTPSMRGPAQGFITATAPNVVIETIKRAEDGQGYIVRLYECMRRRGPITLSLGFEAQAAWRTNLLEENEAALPLLGRQLSLVIKPYEIVTLRLIAAQ
jgi:alpha-mannosidase